MVYKMLMFIFTLMMILWWIKDDTSHWVTFNFVGLMANAILVKLDEISKQK